MATMATQVVFMAEQAAHLVATAAEHVGRLVTRVEPVGVRHL